jgi:uncharacterized protein (UPF0548 family)
MTHFTVDAVLFDLDGTLVDSTASVHRNWARIATLLGRDGNEVDRRGFAYGTLPGHPEKGEEAFMIIMVNGSDVRIRVRAFSRPASLLARAGGPITRIAQKYFMDRYVDAIRHLATANTAD